MKAMNKQYKTLLLHRLLMTELLKAVCKFYLEGFFYKFSWDYDDYTNSLYLFADLQEQEEISVKNLDFLIHASCVEVFKQILQKEEIPLSINVSIKVENKARSLKKKIETFKHFALLNLIELSTINEMFPYAILILRYILATTRMDVYARFDLEDVINLLTRRQADIKLIKTALMNLIDNQDFYKFLEGVKPTDEPEYMLAYKYLLVPKTHVSSFQGDISLIVASFIRRRSKYIEFYIAFHDRFGYNEQVQSIDLYFDFYSKLRSPSILVKLSKRFYKLFGVRI